MSTLENPGPFDALEKADPNEPIFPLLGHDADAPATITEWCRLRRNRAIKTYGAHPAKGSKEWKLLKAEFEQCKQAERIAQEMEDYRLGLNCPETGVISRATYREVVRSASELQEAEKRSQRESLCRNLREAQGHVCLARDGLKDMGLIGPVIESHLTNMMAELHGLALEHETKRPGFESEPALPLPSAEA